MFEDIDSFFVMNRKRLWDAVESRFWHNQPERQREMVKNFANRKLLLKSIIENNDRILLKDLAAKLNYHDNRAINKLLEPYLNDKLITKFYDKNDNNTCSILINRK